MSAAAVLAVAAIGLWTLGRSTPPRSQVALEEEVLAGHLRSLLAGHLTDVPSSDRHTVKPWFAGKLDFGVDVFDLGGAGFTLVGGRLDYLGGRTVASLVYKRREHVINVFVWPEQRGRFAPLSDSVRGFQTVRWQAGGMQWWAVSDLNRTELNQFAKLIVAEEEKAHPK